MQHDLIPNRGWGSLWLHIPWRQHGTRPPERMMILIQLWLVPQLMCHLAYMYHVAIIISCYKVWWSKVRKLATRWSLSCRQVHTIMTVTRNGDQNQTTAVDIGLILVHYLFMATWCNLRTGEWNGQRFHRPHFQLHFLGTRASRSVSMKSIPNGPTAN